MFQVRIENAEEILEEIEKVREELRELSRRIYSLRSFDIAAREKPANTQSASPEITC